jgi:MFS family permease
LVSAAAQGTDFTERVLTLGFLGSVLNTIGYALVPLILGAVGGWISDETRIHKIFWVAISGPVIVFGAASGWSAHKIPEALPTGKAGWNFEQLLPITPAYADEAPTKDTAVAQAENPFISGLKEFLGGGSGGLRYRVVIASITDYQEAVKTAAKLNSMKVLPAPASVGQPKFGNPYFPVIVDGWLTLPDAKSLRDKVSGLDLELPDSPYISIRDY